MRGGVAAAAAAAPAPAAAAARAPAPAAAAPARAAGVGSATRPPVYPASLAVAFLPVATLNGTFATAAGAVRAGADSGRLLGRLSVGGLRPLPP